MSGDFRDDAEDKIPEHHRHDDGKNTFKATNRKTIERRASEKLLEHQEVRTPVTYA